MLLKIISDVAAQLNLKPTDLSALVTLKMHLRLVHEYCLEIYMNQWGQSKLINLPKYYMTQVMASQSIPAW
ncbi:MAG: hypothetical protein OFPII_39060 [Osedax symbiont Rs1]|nr:MAG: hypothetical protein OFPII_39060 [Osedax symbiont Rs1]